MTDEELRRLSWRCRRGLLELDIVLQQFSEVHMANLSVAELQAFNRLLDLPDNDFLDILTKRIDSDSNHVDQDEAGMPTLLTKLRMQSN